MIFDYGNPPLKVNGCHICDNYFHENWMDLYIFKNETLANSLK
jgi:hypothetical protein